MTKQFITDKISVEYKTLKEVNELVDTLGINPASVAFDAVDVGNYDSEYNSHIVFNRLETDEEYNKRVSLLTQRQQEIEKRERENYERLHKKYGNKG